MTYDVAFLKKVMDKVRNEPAFRPTKKATFCNLATHKLCCELGLPPFFWEDGENRPMMANEMVVTLETNPDKFSKFTDHARAWDLARKGHLVFAARSDHPHGHIAPLYPSEGMISSVKWKSNTIPLVSNVGVRNDVIGVNFAFAEVPGYYLVI
jgi:hypothetical protein